MVNIGVKNIRIGSLLITLIDHIGKVGVKDCSCDKCNKPMRINEWYHRKGNRIYCKACDIK